MPTPSNGGEFRGKVRELDALAEILEECRRCGKTIVHCHGVFDPLHIGHIRHFEEARKLGDVLVVTVTPDHFVNKGPHRPIFPEALRAEVIAALELVDHVAINRWPTAVETIQLLRPNLYVKGSEFRSGQDRLGAIGPEEEAISGVGGKIAFTNDITFSASNLVNRHFPVFPEAVSEYLGSFARRYSTGEVLRYLDGAQEANVLVVGEAIIDEYVYCEAIGKSSKEPTLVVKQLSSELFAGGVLAASNHIASFCDRVSLITSLGLRSSYLEFIQSKLRANIRPSFLFRRDSPTIQKRRYLEHYFFQKLFEVYDINDTQPSEEDDRALCDLLRERVQAFDLVVVFDFGHGLLTQAVVDVVCSAARFLVINTQSNAGNLGYHSISKYHRADLVCVTETEARLEARDRRGDLRAIVLDIARRLECGRIIVTRGKHGCLCYDRTEGFVEVPAFGLHVVDRLGGGDAFLSLASLSAYQNAPIEVIGFIGNVAGAQAVATVGHRASVERVPLLRHIEHLLK